MLWGIFSFEYCPLCFGANHLVLFFLFFSNIKTLIAQRDAPICQYLKKLNINFHNYKKNNVWDEKWRMATNDFWFVQKTLETVQVRLIFLWLQFQFHELKTIELDNFGVVTQLGIRSITFYCDSCYLACCLGGAVANATEG